MNVITNSVPDKVIHFTHRIILEFNDDELQNFKEMVCDFEEDEQYGEIADAIWKAITVCEEKVKIANSTNKRK